MVSLANGSGNRSGGYTFEDDSDEPSDSAPLMSRQPANESSTTKHIHILTGYLSAMEAVLLLCYMGSLVGINQYNQTHHLKDIFGNKDTDTNWLVAIFCVIHSLVWVAVAVVDRVVQWRHQVIRRNGYLKFYRTMKNIRRVPLFAISLGTAVLLMFVSLLYLYQVKSGDYVIVKKLTATYVMYIIVGLEMAVTVPCLIYYFIKCVVFNCQKPPPDVIQDTSSSHGTPTNTLTTVGFRDGEDIDELLERQSDMIRYLQQHNASLGRRIMELQSRVPPE